VTPCSQPPRLARFDVDDGVVLLLESSGKLIFLNPTAAFIWSGIDAGLSIKELISKLAEHARVPLERATTDCTNWLAEWKKLCTLETEYQSRHDLKSLEEPPTVVAAEELLISLGECEFRFENLHRLLDFGFNIRVTNAEDKNLIRQLIGDLPECVGPVKAVFDLIPVKDRYILRQNGRVIDSCRGTDELLPMIHASLLLAAYMGSDCTVALHAAALSRGDRCVLLPGPSGAGKSTLSAALLARDFEFCSDDLVLLTGAPIRVRGLGVRVGLKKASWAALMDTWPELEELPIYRRPDGKLIRYFLPSTTTTDTAAHDSYTPSCVVFPSYGSNVKTELIRVGTGEALQKLAAAGYDLRGRINRELVSELIDWLSTTPCYELRYGDLDHAVDAVEELLE